MFIQSGHLYVGCILAVDTEADFYFKVKSNVQVHVHVQSQGIIQWNL